MSVEYRSWMSGEQARYAPVALILLASLGLFLFLCVFHSSEQYPELRGVARTGAEWGFEDASRYFRELAERKGAPYAYDILLRAPLPPGLDLHLLAHVVGDILYKQQGIAGMSVCTPDFRNACSHSVVIGALISSGVSVLPKLGEVCKQAPGGSGAYTMCFHGLGHGVLAFVEYHLPDAVELCKTLGTPEYRDREYVECVGGTIMELISGVHDRVAWQKAATSYFKDDDPLYPCNASFMPAEARPMCYTYLTPHLFEAAGGALSNPTAADFKKAFAFCEAIPMSQSEDRQACLGGPGKEFVVLAPARDIRSIGSMTEDNLRRISSWCSLAPTEEGRFACDGSAVASLYWGGENDAAPALGYCGLMDSPRATNCFDVLFGEAHAYAEGPARAEFCARVPQAYAEACRVRVGV